MKTYISILRGINVGGQRIIKMDALKQLYTDLGFAKVQTYIQSGNVIFQNAEAKPEELARLIAEKITEKFGFDVPVMVIVREEFEKIVLNNPFLKDTTKKDVAHWHITFLSALPTPENLSKILPVSYLPDEFQVLGKAIYIYCPNSYSNSKLTNSFFETKLKVTATTRNWKTSKELLEIAEKLT